MNASTRRKRHVIRVRQRWAWIQQRQAQHDATRGPSDRHGEWCNVCNILDTVRTLRRIQERGPGSDR